MKKRIVSGEGPVLVESPSYQEREVIVWVRDNVIFTCPYEGPKHEERAFRDQLNIFFWHILQSSLYPSRKHKKKRFGRVWVPFPAKFGQEKLPMVFGQRGGCRKGPTGNYLKQELEGHFSRSLEWLKANVLEVKPYDRKTGRSREFRIRAEILDSMYTFSPKTAEDILNRTRFYSPLKAVQERYGFTVMEQIERSSRRVFKKRRHDLTALDRGRDRKVRTLYNDVLNKLLPNEVKIEPILDYLEEKSLINSKKARKQFLQVKKLLDTMIEGPIEIVSRSPLTIRYWPVYRASEIGGRLFEVGGGFQNLPSQLKEQCYAVGRNWDMKSSQFNVLKTEFDSYDIQCNFFETISSIEDVAELYGIEKKVAKICFYATIFSGGQLNTSSFSNVFKSLRTSMTSRMAREFLVDWNTKITPLYFAIQDLLSKYIPEFRKNKKGATLKCATGVKYMPDHSDTETKIKRRTLNHMISGMESLFLFDAILNCPNVKGVYSLEHDGALMLVEGDGVTSANALFVEKKFSEKVIFED